MNIPRNKGSEGVYSIPDYQLKYVKANPIKYVLGVDTSNSMSNAYCLGFWQAGEFTYILDKSEPESAEFTKEIENLSKYFNAAIYKEI